MGATKEKLRRGQVALGGWILIGHPAVAEVLAGEGFDWICVDLEHTTTDIGGFYQCALALKGAPCDLLARLHSCDPVQAKLVLDAGAGGIIVPSVNTPDQARQAVAMAKYPPAGTRSASLARATDYGRNFADYFARHNDNVLVVVMLEHIDAVRQADAILATPGIDAAFIGPYDLSASMGLPGQVDRPQVQAAQKTILDAAARHNVPCGIHVVSVNADDVARRITEGYRFIACGLDTMFLMHGCREVLRRRGPMDEVILITESVYRKGLAVFAAPGAGPIRVAPVEEESLAQAVRASRCRAVILGAERYVGPLYHALADVAAGRGAIIARFGVGHDGIDKALARKLGIIVTNTPGVLDISVGEHAVWLMGNLARHISRLDADFRAGAFASSAGIELHGKTLGIIGFGVIGRRVAAMAHFGLGMRVLACDNREGAELERQEQKPLAEILAAHGAESYSRDMDGVLRQCDVVSIHLPSTPQTRRIFDAARLAAMKPGSLLVNTARGAVIDEPALFDALSSGALGGAALDVFEHEPYRPAAEGKDLRTLPNVLLTPHIGSNTSEANARMARASLDNVLNFLHGRLDNLSQVYPS